MRCILAVSGTLQEGFPLRKNLDAPGKPAVHLGSGLVRGVRSYLDVKERGCREFGNAPNPACVVTGDAAERVRAPSSRIAFKLLLLLLMPALSWASE